MRVTAVICEYNPFHNGHALHLREARAGTGADIVVCLMSGNFVQRGAPAIFDKWARTKAALRCGADVVLELPSLYAASSAEYFALGAIATLNACGCVDFLSFGCETDAPEKLTSLARERAQNKAAILTEVRRKMKAGVSYPKAAGERMSSNDLLGLEYLSALMTSKSTISPYPVKRFGTASHNDPAVHSSVTSATSLRTCLQDGNFGKIPEGTMPPAAHEIFEAEMKAGRGPVLPEAFETFIFGKLRTMTQEALRRLPFISEGLEYKLKKEAQACTSLAELKKACVSLRYTESRISRILTALMTGVTAEELAEKKEEPPYIKILGFNQAGTGFLKLLKGNAGIPYFTQTAKGLKILSGKDRLILQKEIYATDLYVLGYPSRTCRIGGAELTRQVCSL